MEVAIKPEEYGLDKEKEQELIGNLPQIQKERSVLEKQFHEIIKLDIDDIELPSKAKELRLLIQKNRTKGINVWHKTTKDFFLKGGQFVDAIKRKEVAINERMEELLENIEKHVERKEQKRLDDLQAERESILSNYMEDAHEKDLSGMDEDIWKAYLLVKKQAHEDLVARLKKEEEEKRKNELAEKAKQQLLEEENDKLRKEAVEQKRLEQIEEEKRVRAASERFLRERAEREERAESARKAQAEQDRLKAELKAKEDQETARLAKIESDKQAELNKGDSEKVKDLITELKGIKTKYTFKSKKNKQKMIDTCVLIDKVINHITL